MHTHMCRVPLHTHVARGVHQRAEGNIELVTIMGVRVARKGPKNMGVGWFGRGHKGPTRRGDSEFTKAQGTMRMGENEGRGLA